MKIRFALATLRDLLGLRGNDGLTRKERAAYAKAYRDKVYGPITPEMAEAFAAWRQRRREWAEHIGDQHEKEHPTEEGR
jgi:hypothetical protein